MNFKNLFSVIIASIVIISFLSSKGKSNSSNLSSPSSLPICTIKSNSIYDGDTLRVVCNGNEEKIRFACIDAPELKQTNGILSRDFLRLLVKDKSVKIQRISSDRYGRTIAQLWVNNNGWKLIQLEQAKAGMVWAYDRYKNNCPNWSEINAAFIQAKNNKKGIFKANPIPPWKWRKSN